MGEWLGGAGSPEGGAGLSFSCRDGDATQPHGVRPQGPRRSDPGRSPCCITPFLSLGLSEVAAVPSLPSPLTSGRGGRPLRPWTFLPLEPLPGILWWFYSSSSPPIPLRTSCTPDRGPSLSAHPMIAGIPGGLTLHPTPRAQGPPLFFAEDSQLFRPHLPPDFQTHSPDHSLDISTWMPWTRPTHQETKETTGHRFPSETCSSVAPHGAHQPAAPGPP